MTLVYLPQRDKKAEALGMNRVGFIRKKASDLNVHEREYVDAMKGVSHFSADGVKKAKAAASKLFASQEAAGS